MKHSARERYENFHAKMIVWNNFADGLNGSMQRAHRFLSVGKYDKAKQVFARVTRTTDQFARDHPS